MGNENVNAPLGSHWEKEGNSKGISRAEAMESAAREELKKMALIGK